MPDSYQSAPTVARHFHGRLYVKRGDAAVDGKTQPKANGDVTEKVILLAAEDTQ